MSHGYAIAGCEHTLGNVKVIYREGIGSELKECPWITSAEPVESVCRKVPKLPYGTAETPHHPSCAQSLGLRSLRQVCLPTVRKMTEIRPIVILVESDPLSPAKITFGDWQRPQEAV